MKYGSGTTVSSTPKTEQEMKTTLGRFGLVQDAHKRFATQNTANINGDTSRYLRSTRPGGPFETKFKTSTVPMVSGPKEQPIGDTFVKEEPEQV